MPDFTQVIAMLEDIRRLAATAEIDAKLDACLLYTSPSPRD